MKRSEGSFRANVPAWWRLPLVAAAVIASGYLVPATGCGGDESLDLLMADEEGDVPSQDADELIVPLPEGAFRVIPDGDTSVVSGRYADRNFGAETLIKVDDASGGSEFRGYLLFDLRSVAKVGNARLRLFTRATSADGADVIALPDLQFDESRLTWNRQPTRVGTRVAIINSTRIDTWIDVDVTGGAVPGKWLVIRLNARGTDGFTFNSKEAATNRPRLVLLNSSLVTDGGVPPAADGGVTPPPSSDGGMECTDAGTPGPIDAGTPSISYANEIQPIWNARCLACHSAGGFAGLNLSAGLSYGALVGVASVCSAAQPRVTAYDPARSLLYLKLADDPAKCGSAMPPTGSLKSVAPTELEKVQRWILEGAKNN